jgi:pyrimidine operon attenuation protein / uracil phosphoribosyltransferase
MKTIVLDSIRIQRIIRRIAFQTIEACHGYQGVTLVGIKPRGVWVAHQLFKELEAISKLDLSIIELDLTEVIHLEKSELFDHVLIIDDIVNSGDTMMRASALFTDFNLKRLMTACLVDRMHRRFPIHSDFTGLSLATTLQENLALILDDEPRIILE